MRSLSAPFQLSAFERSFLLLCLAMELDNEVPTLCARAQSVSEPYPTFGLALRAFPDPSWDALSPGGTLRRWRLVEVERGGARTLLASAVRIDERIA